MARKRRGQFTRARRRAYPRPRATRRARARKGLLGINVKATAAGAVGLMAVKVLRSKLGVNLGGYNAPAENIATGAALKMLKLDNADLISSGIKMGVAQAGSDLLAGRGILGFGAGTSNSDRTGGV